MAGRGAAGKGYVYVWPHVESCRICCLHAVSDMFVQREHQMQESLYARLSGHARADFIELSMKEITVFVRFSVQNTAHGGIHALCPTSKGPAVTFAAPQPGFAHRSYQPFACVMLENRSGLLHAMRTP